MNKPSVSHAQGFPSAEEIGSLVKAALAAGLKPGEFDVLAGNDGLSIRLNPVENWREIDADFLRAPPAPGHCVYVVGVRGFDLVKIGFSRDVPRRLRELSSGSGMGDGLVELLRLPGDTRLERTLHKRFAEQRLFGEWFSLSGQLADWIAAGGRDPA